jgi:hypothetical protein
VDGGEGDLAEDDDEVEDDEEGLRVFFLVLWRRRGVGGEKRGTLVESTLGQWSVDIGKRKEKNAR